MSRSELRYLRSLLTPPLRTRRLALLGGLIGATVAAFTIPWLALQTTQRAAFVTPHPNPGASESPSSATPQHTNTAITTTPTLQIESTMPPSDLTDAHKKDIAMQLVSSAENSSLDWRAQYGYIEDIGDGRGYTGGIVGVTSGTGDMLDLVQYYDTLRPGNALAKYLPALQSVNGSDSHAGLGAGFVRAWKAAAADPTFQTAQDNERDRIYFTPAVSQAKTDGLHALGQFMYYDALVMHGPGDDRLSFGGIRAAALAHARTPAQGGDETTYLNAFLNARSAAMKADPSHQETDRIDTEQRPFLAAGNLDLTPPLTWSVYGDTYSIDN